MFKAPVRPAVDQKAIDDKKRREAEYAEKKRLWTIRANRTHYVSEVKKNIELTIPPLFNNARLSDFSQIFRDRLNSRNSEQGLYLWGSTGTGKSHTMAALMRQAITQRKSVKRTTWEKLCLAIRATFGGKTESELDIVNFYTSPDLLVIEDLGTSKRLDGQESEFNLRTLYLILDERLENLRPTFITSNKSVENIGQSFDERIASRLKTFKILSLNGKDKREKM